MRLVIEFMDGLPEGLGDILKVAATLQKIKIDRNFYFVKIGIAINIGIIEAKESLALILKPGLSWRKDGEILHLEKDDLMQAMMHQSLVSRLYIKETGETLYPLK